MTLLGLIGSLVGVLGAFAAVPVLIHLINLMRHRRVKWAAMDFLLQSYRRHRNWIWLKQLLLLALRMAAMVLIALMLCLLVHRLLHELRAQLGVSDAALTGLFGTRPTHHYVLLDDSFSMSDRVGSMTAFERARQTISVIARRAGHQENQRLTLARFSKAAGSGTTGPQRQVAEIVDLNAIEVDKDFEALLAERSHQIEVSQLAAGPVAALHLVRQLVEQREEEKAIVYVLSDFRAKEWDRPAEIQKALEALKARDAEIQLINCVKAQRENLAITRLVPENETRAAGVPLFIDVAVKNYSTRPARNVQVKIRSILFDPDEAQAGEPDRIKGHADSLPTVLFERIGPGQTATNRVQVFFAKPGKHVVQATLQDDAVATDNQRWCVVDFLEGVPVLIIDSSPTQRNGYFLAAAFDPDGRKNTGIRPDVHSVAFLRDATMDALGAYHAIYLADVDVDQLGQTAIQNLEAYVRGGGGLAIFVGPHVRFRSYNEKLYRGGDGLFPLPLAKTVELPELINRKTPDLVVSDHPVFQAIMAERNPLINLVTILRYAKPPVDWIAGGHPDVEIIARLRDGSPLAVDRKFGDGRVVAFLTTLGPVWNNWTSNPTFVVVALKLQAYLASSRPADLPRRVGAPIQLVLNVAQYRRDVTFVVPSGPPEGHLAIDRTAIKPAADAAQMVVSLGGPHQMASGIGETCRSGIYEAWTYTTDGMPDVRRYALNVDSAEGDLALADWKMLLTKLETVKPIYLHWDEIHDDPIRQAGFHWGKWILLILLVLLVLEQIMAWALSYHPRRGAVP